MTVELIVTGALLAEVVNVPFVGEVDLEEHSIVLSTILIALADGFNPCSLWVLVVLIGLVSHSGRSRVALVGTTFLLVTAGVYGLFIVGVLSAFHYVAHLDLVRYVVAICAFVFAAASVKEYVAFGRGPSLTIPDRVKPRIVARTRELIRSDGTVTTVVFTALFAGGVALIELPCTAGFPLVWSGLVVEANVGGLSYAGLVVTYVLTYLSLELVVFFAAVGTLSRIEYDEARGRALKLFSGVMMLFLGSSILAYPGILENVGLTVAVVLLSVIVTAFVVGIDRYV